MKVECITNVFNDESAPGVRHEGALETSAKTPFKYGWCETDHKNGRKIREDFRQTDYMNDEPYASRVRAMLQQLGVPFPAPEEIFRGTHHDLLFLNSHGVVLRIGPTDVTDMMNPAILQPLGWLEDREHMIGKVPFTVAVYPGIEHFNNYDRLEKNSRPPIVGQLRNFLDATGQNSYDVNSQNTGIIRVLNDEGQEVAVKVLLDPDNQFNSSSQDLSAQRSTSLQEHEKSSQDKSDVLSRTLQDVFNQAVGVKYWQRAFQLHQPLRKLFWEAFEKTDSSDPLRRNAFWDKCARVTNRPQPVNMPVWSLKTGVAGRTTFIRKEIRIPNLVLYRAWTGEEADKIIEPIQQTAMFKTAVQRAHDALEGTLDFLKAKLQTMKL